MVAATIDIRCFVGGGSYGADFQSVFDVAPSDDPNVVDKSDIVFNLNQANVVHTTGKYTSPLRIPATLPTYSWRYHFKIYARSGLDGSWIANLRWFAGPEPLDWQDQLKMYVKTAETYFSSGPSGTSPDEFALVSGMVDASTYDNSNPLPCWTDEAELFAEIAPPIDGATGGNPIPVIGENASYGLQNYVVMQLAILPTCKPGVKSSRAFSYRWDQV
jgi:hypothetical protein